MTDTNFKDNPNVAKKALTEKIKKLNTEIGYKFSINKNDVRNESFKSYLKKVYKEIDRTRDGVGFWILFTYYDGSETGIPLNKHTNLGTCSRCLKCPGVLKITFESTRVEKR